MNQFKIDNHLLFNGDDQVEFIDTPNKSEGSISPRYAIQHYTADVNPASTKSWFKNPDANASAHILIDRQGNVTQFVKFNKKAWHAGESEWDGIEGLNSFSIGIELTNAGRLTKIEDKFFFVTKSQKIQIANDQVLEATHRNETKSSYWQKYTDVQLEVCKQITEALVAHYNLYEVLGHDEIAPKRKSDPGPAFPMEDFIVEEVITTFKTTSNLNFRVGPGTEYKIIEVIPKNLRVLILEKRDTGWTRIRYREKLGWVSSKFLAIS